MSEPESLRDVDVVVIGAGFSGLLSCMKLKQLGLDRIVLLERGDRIGGTWAFNVYPGVACDVRSYHYLPLHYLPDYVPDRNYSSGEEILHFIDLMVQKNDLRRHIELGKSVNELRLNPNMTWTTRTDQGDVANGPLSEPKLPEVQGLEKFKGPQLHTSRFDSSVDLKGKRVGVIGTGASAVQVVPVVAKEVEELFVFQRTPAYVAPRNERPLKEKLKKSIRSKGEPFIQELRWNFCHFWDDEMLPKVWNNPERNEQEAELFRQRIRDTVHDQEVAAKLCPTYAVGCKRIIVSDDYLPTFNRPNVNLVADPGGVASLTERGVVMGGGERVEGLDALIFATGFDAARGYFNSINVTGKDGIKLEDVYKEGPQTVYGMCTAGFPNMFIMCGPQGFNSHISTTEVIDVQSDWVVYVIENVLKGGPECSIDASPHAQELWVDWCATLGRDSVLSKCNNWYNGNGGAVTTYAGSWWQYIASLMSDTTRTLDVSNAQRVTFEHRFMPKHAKLPPGLAPRSLL